MPQAIARITTFHGRGATGRRRPSLYSVKLAKALEGIDIAAANIAKGEAPKSGTMALIDKLAADLAAKGSPVPNLPKEPRLPGVTAWGKMTDQRAYTDAMLARIAARKGGSE